MSLRGLFGAGVEGIDIGVSYGHCLVHLSVLHLKNTNTAKCKNTCLTLFMSDDNQIISNCVFI